VSQPDRINPASYTQLEHVRPQLALLEAAGKFGAATLHEAASRLGALPGQIKPVARSFRLCGPAVTVHSPGGDNLWLHRGIYAAQPGDVLVVHVSGQFDFGYWGEIMSTAARARKLGGLVIDGCVRDGALLESLGFPVFARGLCIRGTGKDFGARGWINHPLLIGDVVVQAGDLIVGDLDGVVAIPQAQLATVLAASRQREDHEAEIVRRLEAGATTLELFGW
jgi:4-hydroxy-4-methyl-2-oxoglutarate aldolase